MFHQYSPGIYSFYNAHPLPTADMILYVVTFPSCTLKQIFANYHIISSLYIYMREPYIIRCSILTGNGPWISGFRPLGLWLLVSYIKSGQLGSLNGWPALRTQKRITVLQGAGQAPLSSLPLQQVPLASLLSGLL